MTGREAAVRGYKQLSRRHRVVARLVGHGNKEENDGIKVDPVVYLKAFNMEKYERIQKIALEEILREKIGPLIDEVQLSEEEFLEFRRAGGDTP